MTATSYFGGYQQYSQTQFFLQPLADDNYACHCLNPTEPKRPTYSPEAWPATMNMNIQLINQSLAAATNAVVNSAKEKTGWFGKTTTTTNSESSSSYALDVVFLGDSITEHWNGRDMGEFREKDQNTSLVFQNLFQKQKNHSEIEGLALGIAGDRVSSMLIFGRVVLFGGETIWIFFKRFGTLCTDIL